MVNRVGFDRNIYSPSRPTLPATRRDPWNPDPANDSPFHYINRSGALS